MLKKILIVNASYYPYIIGGAERSVQVLAEELVKENINVNILTLSNENKVDIINGVKVYYLKSKNLFPPFEGKNKSKIEIIAYKLLDFYNPLLKSEILRVIKQEKPDIIHTNNLVGFSVYFWNIVRPLKIPIVHTIRDHYLLCIRSTMFKNNKMCKSQCVSCKTFCYPRKKLSQKVDAVVGVSEKMLNTHLDYGYFQHSKVKTHIYNPVEIKVNTPKRFSKGAIKFGFIGQINKGKGIEFLLNQFLKLADKNIELYIFGKGFLKYEKILKEKYQHPKIKFWGFKSQEEIYSKIDIAIVPTLYDEPFPRITLEANSYGIPVIGSNRGGIPEGIIDKKTGFIFSLEKRDDLKEKMEIFIKNPHLIEEFSKNCIEFVKKFDKEKIVNQYIEVYKQVLKYYES